MLRKFIRELQHKVPVTTDKIAIDDGTDEAKHCNADEIPMSLKNLTDTDIPTPANGEVLEYNELDGKWKSEPPAAALGFATFEYKFATSTDDTPNPGHIQYNHTDPAQATYVFINEEDRIGRDRSLFFDFISVGDWFNLHDRDDVATRHQKYDVTGDVTKIGDIYHIPVTYYEQIGTNFPNNFNINLFIRFMSQQALAKHAQTHEVGGSDEIDYNNIKNIPQAPGMWQDYTPTWTNFTLGDGTVTARYTQIGKTVHFKCVVQLGSTSSVNGSIESSLPVPPTTESKIINVGVARMHLGAPSKTFFGVVALTTASRIAMVAQNATGNSLYNTNTSSTIPGAWGANDDFAITGTYEAL